MNLQSVIGAPDGDIYGYGLLITFLSNAANYQSVQIYIPHNAHDICIRTFADTNGWRKITADFIPTVI